MKIAKEVEKTKGNNRKKKKKIIKAWLLHHKSMVFHYRKVLT
jgi:hypothetical protein